MLQTFDRRKLHLAVWLSIRDPTVHLWERDEWEYPSLRLHGTPLHYAGFCGLYDVVKVLVTEYLSTGREFLELYWHWRGNAFASNYTSGP